MNRRKLNISSWYSLGLAVVLVMFCLVLSTGVTWARYRTDVDKSIYFQTRKPVSVYLGQVEYVEDQTAGENTFVKKFFRADNGSWKYNEAGELQMEFAIANGVSEMEYEYRDQQVYVRLIGTLGVQTENQPISLTLTVPGEDEPEVLEATAVPIHLESPLYTTFGEGWMFCFRDAQGEERSWTLKGEELSYIEMELTLTDGTLADTSLLQMQISGRYQSD